MSKKNSVFNIEELTAPNHGMKRDMGLMRAVGLMAGLMIGSGIFYVGAFVLDYVNLSTGMALLAWLIAGVLSLFAGLCYAEMGTAMPRSGGSYVYITESFGPVAGFTMGWSDFWICQTGSIAAADNPTFNAMETIFGTGIAAALTIGVILAILGSANSAILAYPREYYAMARDKRWFPIFGKIDKKSRTPKNSQIITMCYACIICFIADFQSLIDIAVLATWIYYSLGVASCIVLRRKYPQIDRPYKVWGYPVLPIIVVIFGVIMLTANFLTDPHTILGLLIPLSGVPAYFCFSKYYETHAFPDLDEGIDLD